MALGREKIRLRNGEDRLAVISVPTDGIQVLSVRSEKGDALPTGERPFWRALKTYTRRFASRAVVGRDFQRVFAAETDRDLSALFDAWVYGSGRHSGAVGADAGVPSAAGLVPDAGAAVRSAK
jgi:hypothetical protein